MSGGIPLDLIIFAAIALFLIFRLGGVLGKRTGHQRRLDPFAKRDEGKASPRVKPADNDDDAPAKPVALPRRRKAAAGKDSADAAFDGDSDTDDDKAKDSVADDPLAQGLAAIGRADANFNGDFFLNGAKAAFEMIVTAYAQGDGDTLKPLLSKDVLRNFTAAITAREKQGQRMDATLTGIDEASIVAAGMEGRMAHVTVRFESQQINVTYGPDDAIVAGDPEQIEAVTDIWTFQRDVRSRDPGWYLSATRSPD